MTDHADTIRRTYVLSVGEQVWSRGAPEYHGRVTEVKGTKRRRYMVRWDGYDHDSGEYGITEFFIRASAVRL